MDIVRFPSCTGSYNDACMIFVANLHYKFQRQKSLINVRIFSSMLLYKVAMDTTSDMKGISAPQVFVHSSMKECLPLIGGNVFILSCGG